MSALRLLSVLAVLVTSPLSAERLLDLSVLERPETCPPDALPEMRLKIAFVNEPAVVTDQFGGSDVRDCRIGARKAGKRSYDSFVECSQSVTATEKADANEILVNFTGELVICPQVFSYDVHWLSREVELVMGGRRVKLPNENADKLTQYSGSFLEYDPGPDPIDWSDAVYTTSQLITHCIDVSTLLTGRPGDYVYLRLAGFGDEFADCEGELCQTAVAVEPLLQRYDSTVNLAACEQGLQP